MRCFIHRDKEAIAICRACGKGVCPECSVDVGRGLACKTGNCEQVSRDYIELIDRNIQLNKQNVGGVSVVQSKQGVSPANIDHLSLKLTTHAKWNYGQTKSNAIFCISIGLLFLMWAISDFQKFSFALLFAISFIIYGTLILRRVHVTDTPHPQVNKTKTG